MTERELTLVEAPTSNEIPEYYSNVVRVVSSIYDITILFGRGVPVGFGGDAARMDEICAIHMSAAHAKGLFLILRDQLRNYEKRWGKLPVPPDLVEKYGENIDG
jgi:hypothetical protein